MEDELILDLSKTYIHEGEEYILTGRVAEKSSDAPPARPRRSKRQRVVNITPEKDMMVEIRPSPKGSRPIMGVSSENKWVRMGELYAVVNIFEDDEEEK